MPKITEVTAWEILDSRGNPTVEGEVHFSDGSCGKAAVPSGASKGVFEALELRDKDEDRYSGKGVRKAVANVRGPLRDILLGREGMDQSGIDSAMTDLDGTKNKEVLGANAILAVSLAVAKASAQCKGQPLYRYLGELCGNPNPTVLPVPQINILNGGAHADNVVDFQEFMIMPVGAEKFSDALCISSRVFQCLKTQLRKDGFSTAVGDEGGFAPDVASNEESIQYVLAAVVDAGYKENGPIKIGLDVASSEIYTDGQYRLIADKQTMTSIEFVEFLCAWVEQYPILSIEDGMAESDWVGWEFLSNRLGKSIQITGDDLFVTNVEILREGIARGIANSVLIKPNQIGTLTETLEAISVAKSAGYSVTISHRSGETTDTTIADLAVAAGPCQIKAGSLSRSERTAKYNRLLRIEEELGESSSYAGLEGFSQLSLMSLL